MKKLFSFLTQGMLFMALTLVLTGCDELAVEDNPWQSYLTMRTSDVTLTVGETYLRKAVAAGTAVITYSSSDTEVATVDQEGKVTAIKAGTTMITAQTTGYYAEGKKNYIPEEKSYKVTVVAPAPVVFASNEYNEASWDGTTVVYEKKTATSTPTEMANGYTGSITSGWYTVTGDNVTITGDQMPTGDVHLILCDGAKLTINGKLNCFFYSCNLYIYGQAAGTGILKVKDVNDYTTLSNNTSKMLEIHGGDITVENAYPTASISANGIGLGGGLRMYGGKLTTTAPNLGIQFGSYDLEIYGGEVTATSTADNAIYRPTGAGVLTVYGGKLKATATGTSYAIAAPIKSGTPGIKFYFADSEAGLDTAPGNTYDGTTATPTNKFAKAE